jgi:hypothetical protein
VIAVCVDDPVSSTGRHRYLLLTETRYIAMASPTNAKKAIATAWASAL